MVSPYALIGAFSVGSNYPGRREDGVGGVIGGTLSTLCDRYLVSVVGSSPTTPLHHPMAVRGTRREKAYDRAVPGPTRNHSTAASVRVLDSTTMKNLRLEGVGGSILRSSLYYAAHRGRLSSSTKTTGLYGPQRRVDLDRRAWRRSWLPYRTRSRSGVGDPSDLAVGHDALGRGFPPSLASETPVGAA